MTPVSTHTGDRYIEMTDTDVYTRAGRGVHARQHVLALVGRM